MLSLRRGYRKKRKDGDGTKDGREGKEIIVTSAAKGSSATAACWGRTILRSSVSKEDAAAS